MMDHDKRAAQTYIILMSSELPYGVSMRTMAHTKTLLRMSFAQPVLGT
jgi:hypothetical protein